MKAQTLFTKAVAGFGATALALALGACSHTSPTANQQTGEIRTEAAATTQPQDSSQVIGTAPAPANTQGQPAAPSTPAVISGPAAVDSTGNAYTSSSAGGAGNASSVGLNTNVNIEPQPAPSTVAVTTTPAPVTTETTTTVVETTPAPAPAPIVTETPAPIETPAPMTSSTTTTTTTTVHPRLRKD
ncbi:MAG TPA: hypothetical protein VKH35_05995 [Thermoanaerobaculia bacterium]|jgi:hypothetical protein|nr:hypothetical protein [Thermoanaerobaculia bacterium]